MKLQGVICGNEIAVYESREGLQYCGCTRAIVVRAGAGEEGQLRTRH